MRLTNHIALRFLTDNKLAIEMLESTHPEVYKKAIAGGKMSDIEDQQGKDFWQLVSKENQIAYLVTETVHDKLDYLKVKVGNSGYYDFTVFKNIPNCKKSFILYPVPEWNAGGCLRIVIAGDFIEFCHVHAKFADSKKKDDINCGWTMFYINRKTNVHAEHCDHTDVKTIYEFVYKLLCFIFLSENEEEIVAPGASKGTKKQGKFKNDLDIPVTIINSKWNITTIRTEGFVVSGHFALRRCGVGRVDTKMVYIEPYQKHGYIRKAASESVK